MNMKQLLIPITLTVSLVIFSLNAEATLVHGNDKWTLQGTLGKSVSQVRLEQTGSQWVLPDIGEVNRLLSDRGLTHGLGFKHDVDSKARLTSVGLDSTFEWGFRGLALEYPTNKFWMVEVMLEGTIYSEKTYQWKNWLVGPNDQYAEPVSTVFLKNPPVYVPLGPDGSPAHVPGTSPVPVPGAVWLFGTAIVGLIVRRKLWNKNGAF